jgi:hypothetical protein
MGVSLSAVMTYPYSLTVVAQCSHSVQPQYIRRGDEACGLIHCGLCCIYS